MLQYVHEIKIALETPMTERKNNGGTVLMSLFNMFKKKKPEDSLSFRMEMAKKIAFHRLRYVTER